MKKEIVRKYGGGGSIEVYKGVDMDACDFKKIYDCCDYFAVHGEKTVILPKVHYKDPLYKEIYRELVGTIYERKCPDFKAGDFFYEHEGYDIDKNSDPKRTFGNMISRGAKQSGYIVIEDCGVGRVWAQRIVFERAKNEIDIKGVWIREDNKMLTRLY